MSGATVAALAVPNALPTGGNISGAHTGTLTTGSPTSASVAYPTITLTATWSAPGHGFVLGHKGAAAITSGVGFSVTSGVDEQFYADSTSAVGPVTITLSATGFASSTFTVTLS